jgi:multidrug resistance efflux pump
VVGGALGVWALWFCRGEVSLRALSSSARLEVAGSMYPVHAPCDGRLLELAVVPGQEVTTGDLVAQIDDQDLRHLLAEDEARLEALSAQVATIRGELAAERAATPELVEAEAAALDEARARLREALAVAEQAGDEARRLRQLFATGQVSDLEWRRSQARADQRRAEAEAAELAVARVEHEHHALQRQSAASIAELEHDLAELVGLESAAAANVQRIRHDLERRRVVAPVSGTVAEVSAIPRDAMVARGDAVATLVPAGRLRVVAMMSPVTALGRVRPGQRATLRVLGYPWIEYGALTGCVATVAQEVRNGRLRVELDLDEQQSCKAPLRHGMPVSVEIVVERLTPAALVLRLAGRGVSRE